jgi:hypothetical protein
VTVEVRGDEGLVFVPEVHHPLLDGRGLVVEEDGDDPEQVPLGQATVLELPQ